MTHDELLKAIEFGPEPLVFEALWKVARLHTPITSENMIDGKTGLHYVYCSICFHSQQPATMLLPPVAIEVVYPCETIQVIEKVLSDEIH